MPLRMLVLLVVAISLLTASCASESATADEPVTTSATGDTEVEQPAVDGDDTADDVNADDDSSAAEPSTPLGDQTSEITVVGEPLSVMPPRISVTDADNDPSIGTRAPELTGTDFTGSPVEIVADGTPRVVMFVAHWCPHCQREIPAVKDLLDAGVVPDGLELVVVSTAVRDDHETYPPQRWLEAEGWPGPILRDSEAFDALFAFGAGGFPFSIYLDSNHEVVARSAGELPSDILQELWLATANG